MGDEESGANSVATSCPNALTNWWDVHATSPSSWNSHHHHHPAAANPNSNEDHDISLSTSFSDTSNHSNSFMPEQPSDNHPLWTHVLLNEELQNSRGGGGDEDLMDALSSKSIMYEPAACNYLKKLDNYNSSPINNTSFDHHHNHKQLNGFNNEAMLESSERLSKLVTTWSIAPPDPQVFDHNDTVTMDHSGIFSSYTALDHMKVKQEHHHHHLHRHDHHASEAPPLEAGLFGHQNNNNGFNSHHQYGMVPSLSSSCPRNWTDVISFTGRIGRPIIGIHALKHSFRPPLMTVSDSKKQLFHTSLPTRTSNGRGQGSSTEVKKKRTDDSSSEAISKKPKQETSTASSNAKMQAPKVKLGDRITTLQQIVSPFGKTDTASVLFEAIGYIKFLQEQVQLLSNSCMKTNSHKETWGSMERREETGDLKSRGLCLVPISWIPQAYRDNSTAPDYWTPAYRGCLFR